ncbi:enolase C-terminal domain-like protein [Poseidonocella sedimentorum]|uniref:Enolase C-terminal domain-like n=1 Tax=Poseidonocella sedimentorum TaxID=871652 RepID=A0A1I6D855_9RHOB|nr:enolase C-terminal domain-like protein [Poseidonocella sedimentorum]SFR01527.1 Enolase C-terminal domain-like [Poseidonocella sedimentorum]
MTTLTIRSATWSERPVTMRLPFQFGSTEVRETAEAHARVEIDVNGIRETGVSAQLMVPRWFNKSAEMSNADTIDELRRVVDTAVAEAPGLRGTALEVTRALRAGLDRALPNTPPLARGFGPALVEMAVIDALCKALQVPFWTAARDDAFGLVSGCPGDLSPADLSSSLATISAPKTLVLRHTVGFDAPLRQADVGEDRPKDGRPVSLDEVISDTGVSAFKIKLKGDPEADHRRLRDIAGLLDGGGDYAVTLDANEQYAPEDFGAFLGAIAADTALSRFFPAVRFVEQPFPREVALTNPVDAPLPLIIDESDDREDAFARALTLGWSGTSIKSCKGVLRALINKARAEASGTLLSGEDLTCQPGICWLQDAAMMSACGVRDVERNGHHFAGGLQGAPEAERAMLLERHGDILSQDDNGVALRIAGGRVEIGSLARPGFGC